MEFKVGDRVYYRDNGPDDVGTVTIVNPELPEPYSVTFDGDRSYSIPDWYSQDQLAKVEN